MFESNIQLSKTEKILKNKYIDLKEKKKSLGSLGLTHYSIETKLNKDICNFEGKDKSLKKNKLNSKTVFSKTFQINLESLSARTATQNKALQELLTNEEKKGSKKKSFDRNFTISNFKSSFSSKEARFESPSNPKIADYQNKGLKGINTSLLQFINNINTSKTTSNTLKQFKSGSKSNNFQSENSLNESDLKDDAFEEVLKKTRDLVLKFKAKEEIWKKEKTQLQKQISDLKHQLENKNVKK